MPLPKEVRPGDAVSAAAYNDLLDFVRSLRIQPGLGYRVAHERGGQLLQILPRRGETLVSLERRWWEMSFDDSELPVKLYIENGMCEGPDFISAAVHPERAWEHTAEEMEVADQEITNGTTNFYIKATFVQSQTDMGGTTAAGLNLTGYRYSLASCEIHKETGSPPAQPLDEKLVKYKLLGQVTVAGGKVTKYWWRTNHIFNWTFYAWTADNNSSNSDALPPTVPPV